MEEKKIKKIENYLLYELIGKGSFGEVWLGKNIKNEELIAVKVIKHQKIKKDVEELIKNEIKIMKILGKANNPNIVKLLKYLKTINNSYIVMEYCNNGDLRNYLVKNKTLSENEAVEFFKQILNGLNGFLF